MSALSNAAAGIVDRIKALAERPHGVTVRDLIERYMRVYAGRDHAIQCRLTAWQTLIGDFTLEKLDNDLIYAARNELATLPALNYKGLDVDGAKIFKGKSRAGKKSDATLNRYITAIGSVFSWAIDQRITPRGWVNPCRGVKQLREPAGRVRFLDDVERERLLAECKPSQYPRLHALALMAMLTGARKGELLSLKWANVDLDNAVASLGRTKNGERRTLVLLPQVIAALRPFVSSNANRYVFGAVRTRYQTPATVNKAWAHALKRAEILNFRFHDLRHCCASYLAQAGVPLNVIAEVLGHKRLDMTQRYAHLTTQTKAAAMATALGNIGLQVKAAETT